jgi:cytoskeletal protein CcmA (bactofilin family)
MAQGREQSRGSRTATRATIGSATRVRGRVSGEGDLVVEGQVEGDVRLRGDLTVTEGGSVVGDIIEAHAVHLDGRVEASVLATGAVHLGPGARVRGDLAGAGIAIDDGAEFAGRIACDFELPAELGGGKKGR